MCKENLGTRAGVHSIEGVRLIWGPLNTGFTVHEEGSGTGTIVIHSPCGCNNERSIGDRTKASAIKDLYYE